MKEPNKLRILVVDDEAVVRNSLKSWFEEDGHEVSVAADGREALTMVSTHSWDLVLLDIKMPGMDGLEVQRRINAAMPSVTIIIMTAYATVDTAVEALKAGAADYITKPFEPERLSHLVRQTAERGRIEAENRSLREQLASAVRPTPILGDSAATRRIRELVETVGPTDTTVLITGESGTGKELVARAIHASSPRALMPMVTVNCGALPEGTLESELFGHEKGAFTGAQARHKGKFELADGGTLFLDEIAEVSQHIQVELLRVLEDKLVTRVGGSRPVPTDFRTIAATNKNLAEEMRAGRFRDDLFYRLNVFHIDVPPLRDRPTDIPILARAFLARLAESMNRALPEIDSSAMDVLRRYRWPGNVRELANAIERAMVVQRGPVITTDDLPIDVEGDVLSGGNKCNDARTLADAERRHIASVLRQAEWNVTQAARILDVNRATIYNKIRQYGLTRDPIDATSSSSELAKSR